jgi:hypothetical protein
MAPRRFYALLLVATCLSMGAQYRTQNFLVDAPNAQIAQQVGQYAEHYRREKSLLWLGYEMPPWTDPCPIKVKVTMGGAGGATSFAFDRGQVLGQHMNIEGRLDRLINSVLPHEVTHTVFAYYFRMPVPRWADEGGAVLSEDDIERNRHDQIVREVLNSPGRSIPLRRLFTLKDYPNDVMVLYAEGFSVAEFLVGRSSRQEFLQFVNQGMREGWDQAARVHYRFNNVSELEQAWIGYLRSGQRYQTQPAPALLARNTAPGADPNHRVVGRQTVPPTLPTLSAPTPVVRGRMPEQQDQAASAAPGGWNDRPGYLPGSPTQPSVSGPARDPWQPAAVATQHPQVRLGTPQIVAIPTQQPATPTAMTAPAQPPAAVARPPEPITSPPPAPASMYTPAAPPRAATPTVIMPGYPR